MQQAQVIYAASGFSSGYQQKVSGPVKKMRIEQRIRSELYGFVPGRPEIYSQP